MSKFRNSDEHGAPYASCVIRNLIYTDTIRYMLLASLATRQSYIYRYYVIYVACFTRHSLIWIRIYKYIDLNTYIGFRYNVHWLDDVRDSLRGYSRRGMLYIIPPTHSIVLNSEDRFPQGKVYGGRGIAGRSVLWKLATCESRVKVESQARAVTTEPSRASMI